MGVAGHYAHMLHSSCDERRERERESSLMAGVVAFFCACTLTTETLMPEEDGHAIKIM